MPQHWAIIGGGMLGLTLAKRLREQQHQVTVYEAAPNFGGMASTWSVGDVSWDRFYHVILMSDLALRNLLTDLGIADDLIWGNTRTGFYSDGKLHSMSSSLEFLRFPPLGLVSKFRLALTIMHASRIQNSNNLEAIPVLDWLHRWSGRRTTEKIWLPLLRSKLGENWRITSAAFLWAIIRRMYAARRSGLKREMMGYVRGGYAHILDRFINHLRNNQVDLLPGVAVASITPGNGRPVVTTADGNSQAFDQVILTLPTSRIADLCPDLQAAEIARLRKITYQGIVCASLVLSKPLASYYVTNITDHGLPFTAVIETTTLVDPATFAGQSLIYLPRYINATEPFFSASDDEIQREFVAGLKRMYPQFDEADILAFRVARLKQVFAVSTLGYSQLVPPIATSIPGVSIVTSAQILHGTLNVDETIQLAERAIPMLLQQSNAPGDS